MTRRIAAWWQLSRDEERAGILMAPRAAVIIGILAGGVDFYSFVGSGGGGWEIRLMWWLDFFDARKPNFFHGF